MTWGFRPGASAYASLATTDAGGYLQRSKVGNFFVVRLEPVFKQPDSRIDDVFFNLRAEFEKPAVFMLGTEPHDGFHTARLYQLRSKITISPPAGKCST